MAYWLAAGRLLPRSNFSVPETTWFWACITFADNRQHIDLFLNEINLRKDFRTVTGSAFNFPITPDVTDLLPRFALDAEDFLAQIVRTSFMLYQILQDERVRLTEIITGFVASLDGIWVNADLTPAEGSYHHA